MFNHSEINHANLSIGLEMISPKQLIGESLDLATSMFKDIIEAYCQKNNFDLPFTSQKNDFSMMTSYMLDPSRLDKILQQFVTEEEKSSKALAKSWIFELKYIRNMWAHSSPENLNYRLVNRAFDTLSMIYMAFKGDLKSDLFKKIDFYRKKLLIATAKQYITEP